MRPSAGILLCLASALVAGAATPPRVIIFSLGDDYGFNNVGFDHGPLSKGNPEMRTPNLDRLAMDGVRLERHYVSDGVSVSLDHRASY